MKAPTALLNAVCRKYNVDMDHARHVAAASLALFDALPEVHGLARERRDLLEWAAILHNIALASDPKRHHTAGRDLILAETIKGISAPKRNVLACTTRFHRKKVRPKREPVFRALPENLQKETLALAAILRVGDALDYSGSQSSRIVAIENREGKARVVIDGPNAKEEADRANAKADLWNSTFEKPILVLDAATAAQFPRVAPPLSADGKAEAVARDAPGVEGGDPMAVAGCKVLGFHFQALRKHEPGARKGRDIEATHQMRVATRRLRAAIRVFGPWLPARTMRRIGRRVRDLTRALGPVRDHDVLLQHARRYRRTLSPDERDTFDPLLQSWRNERSARRQKMVKFLDGAEYGELNELIEALACETAKASAKRAEAGGGRSRPRGDLVRHVAPALIWQTYQCVRAYETILEGAPIETIHRLRIECKRLRYALELMREVLGAAGERLIEEMKTVQDHLGELHDRDVTIGLVREFLDGWSRDTGNGTPHQVRGVAHYLAACEQDLKENLAAFPVLWERIAGLEFRRLVAEATAAP